MIAAVAALILATTATANSCTPAPIVNRPAATTVAAARLTYLNLFGSAAATTDVAAAVQARAVTARPASRSLQRRPAAAVRHRPAARPAVRKTKARTPHRVAPRRVHHNAPAARHHTSITGRMGAAVAYAYAQLGSRYVHGASGAGRFDCSGLTMRAFGLARLRLPHSSGGQAAMARRIPRSVARPGDLVVGPGHVGIYVGRGYMIDAGNPRVGVSYRRMYPGLWIERF